MGLLGPDREAVPPARVPGGPAELPLGLGVGGAAGLGHQRDDEVAGQQLAQPGGGAHGRLHAEAFRQVGQPLPDRGRVVVDDVVDAGRAAGDGRGGRGRGVGDLGEGPDARAPADDGHPPLPHDLEHGVRGARAVEHAVTQHQPLGRGAGHGLLDVPDRRHGLLGRRERVGVQRIGFGLDLAAGPGVVPADEALRDEPAGACLPGGFQQVVGALGAQFVGDRELLVEVAEAAHAGQRGHLVHDDVRLRGLDRVEYALTVQAVDDGGGRAGVLQLAGLGRRARGAGDLVAGRDQTGDQVLADRSGRPRDEDSHDCFLPLLSFLSAPLRRQCPPGRDTFLL